jgi:hypothetical protein
VTVAELAEKVRAITRTLYCDCFADGEFNLSPCPRCRLEEALEGDTDE